MATEAHGQVLQTFEFRALWKLEYYRGQMLPFERKYGLSFEEFKARVEKASQESFEEWDDLVEWEAYHQAYQEWLERWAARSQPPGKHVIESSLGVEK